MEFLKSLLEKIAPRKETENRAEAIGKIRDEKKRAQAVRELLGAPKGSLSGDTFLDIIEKDSSPKVRLAATKTLFKRLEASKEPIGYAYLGPRLAELFLKERDRQIKKLLDETFNEIHFAIVKEMEEEEALHKKDALGKEPEVLAFERTKTSIERKNYDRKYENYLENFRKK
ncbi:hypothetical protein HZC09_03045 [Candidatus Micrarchaeota archaeon]|nr:hypothetical protein [Candidatus Micrarchaeota archaeon]